MVLAHKMAVESEFVEAEMVEAMEFGDLASRYNVSGVPHTIINSGAGEMVGAYPEEAMVEEIRQALGR